MKIKFCYITDKQKEKYLKELHSDIHWLLVYKENGYKKLDVYFSSLLFKIGGLNSLLHYPPEMIELLSLLEAARLESKKNECDYKIYRKAVLDAHSLIDKIFEKQEG